MNEEEVIEQLESLIEAWQLDEADLNQTDINAIKKMLDKNKQLKEQLEKSEKARVKCINKIKTLGKFDGENFTRNFTLWSADFNELEKILDIDKGE